MIGQEVPFKLSEQVADTDFYKLMTQLPKSEEIRNVNNTLPPYTAKMIVDCIVSIYSYVTERDYVEETETFFMHTCATVFYENRTQVLIKDRDHAKKAANILNMLENNIAELSEKLSSYPYSEQQRVTLTKFIKLLESHAMLFRLALSTASEEKRAHLKQFMGVDVDEQAPVCVLSPSKKAAIKSTYPASPQKNVASPQKTPKKLSAADRESLNELLPHTAKRRKQLSNAASEEASSEDPWVIEPSSLEESDSYEGKLMRCSSEDDLDIFLSTQVDACLTFRPIYSVSKTASDEAKTSKNEVPKSPAKKGM